jgi:hypothetical protein
MKNNQEILVFIISLIFYLNLFQIFDNKIYFNLTHSIIFSIMTVYSLIYEYNKTQLNILFYKLVLIHEVSYNLSDILLNTKNTKGKYLNHHLAVLLMTILSLYTDVEMKFVFRLIGIVQIGNIFYHLARIKLIKKKYSSVFYTMSSIICFFYFHLNIDYNFLNKENYLVYLLIYSSIYFVGLWRLFQTYLMYNK